MTTDSHGEHPIVHETGDPGHTWADKPAPSGAAEQTASDHRTGHAQWLGDYVYGTIATLVAIAGLTFETNPGALTTAGVVVVGAVAIWLAHALSDLVVHHSWRHLRVRPADVWGALRGSWSIVAAAIPATMVFVLAGAHVWEVRTSFVIAEVIGALALAVVGIGTVGGARESLVRRVLYITGFVSVGVLIVLLESAVHLL